MNHPSTPVLENVARIAAEHAGSVDVDGRFPSEAIAALRSARLLALIPSTTMAGQQDGLAEASYVCCVLGRACGSSGLIYAMHLSQLACLVAGAHLSPWHAQFLAKVVSEQLLLGSVTSEAGVGGDIRTSSCSIQVLGNHFELHKEAPTASYATYADALLVTARRSVDATSSDQVLIVVTSDMLEIIETRRWNTLGMRGTCSGGYRLQAHGVIDQVCPMSFSDLAEQVMVPISHVLWGSVWLGIAAGAVERARAFLAAKARCAVGGNLSPYTSSAALRLERSAADLRTMEARLQAAIEATARQQADVAEGRGTTLSFLVCINGLKITLSDLAVSIVSQCMRICGTEGYRNDGPYSLGRHLRDVHSAPLMVNNDRIATNNAHLALVQKTLASVL